MTGKTTILILAAVLASMFCSCLLADDANDVNKPNQPTVLREDTLIEATYGQLIRQDEKWSFKFDTDVNDLRTTIKAGTPFDLLPSSALQEMIDISKTAKLTKFKLWAIVTKYKNKNFLFTYYSLPVSEPNTPMPAKPAAEPNETQQPKKNTSSAADIDDPNDDLSVPAEIKKRLSPTRVIRPAQLIALPKTKQKIDSTMADRTGFIVETDPNQFVFVFDEIGRNVQKISIPLLPCQALELSQKTQLEEPEKIRFKIAGRVTIFEDKYYMLLQRAAHTYSFGNFKN
jgi:hypothetical protein